MRVSLTDRIKHCNEDDPNYIIQAFSSDLYEIVKRAESAEARAAELERQLSAEQAAHKSDVEALNVRINALSRANENLASKILMLERKLK